MSNYSLKDRAKNLAAVGEMVCLIREHYNILIKHNVLDCSCTFANYTVGICCTLVNAGKMTIKDMDAIHRFERLCSNKAYKNGREQFLMELHELGA